MKRCTISNNYFAIALCLPCAAVETSPFEFGSIHSIRWWQIFGMYHPPDAQRRNTVENNPYYYCMWVE